MPDRKGEAAQRRLAAHHFGDPDVLALLDEATVEALYSRLGAPRIVTRYAEPMGHWSPGDGRPPLADDDPAAMQSVGRCAASRIRGVIPLPGAIHPAECGWCAYPLAELLRACDWATWHSRYVLAELAVWAGAEGSTYTRELRANVYDNPRWAAWFALSPKERGWQVGRVGAVS